jgi:hypothetical protein
MKIPRSSGPGAAGAPEPSAHRGHNPTSAQPQQTHQGLDGHQGGHGWMMIACCIPMLIIAVALLATGVVSVGFLVFAVACTAMMALMMRGMGGHGSDQK